MAHLPKYRRHKSSNRGFVEHKKKRHYLPGEYNSTESIQAYRLFISDVLLTRDQTASIAEIKRKISGLTVGEVAVDFLNWAQVEFGIGPRSTYNHYRNAVAVLVARFRSHRINEITPRDLQLLQTDMVGKTDRAGKPWSRRYVNEHTQRIKRVFKWAVQNSLCEANVYYALQTVEGLRRGRTSAPESAKVSPACWETQVLPVVHHARPVIRAMIMVQWYTGARSGSLCQATPGQFVYRENVLLWNPRHKTEHLDREICLPLGPRAQHWIAPYLQRDSNAFCFNPQEGRNGSNRRYNDHYAVWTYRQAIKRVQEKVGVPPWTPHQLRHARGQLVRDKYGVEAAQSVLAHDSLDATQIYAERALATAIRISQEIG